MNDHDEYDHVRDDALQDAMYESISETFQKEGATSYLKQHGDLVQKRVNDLIDEARALSQDGFYRASLIVANTAVEIVAVYLLFRPLVQGAFLNEVWFAALRNKIIDRRTEKDRKLLLSILEAWGIDISALHLLSGQPLLEVLEDVKKKRDLAIHRGHDVDRDSACVAIDCAKLMVSEVALLVAKRLDIKLVENGKWSSINQKCDPCGKCPH